MRRRPLSRPGSRRRRPASQPALRERSTTQDPLSQRCRHAASQRRRRASAWLVPCYRAVMDPSCALRRPAVLSHVLPIFWVVAALCFSRNALATKPVHVYSVYYSVDTSNKPQIETFFGCLTSSSSFGGSWAAEFGIGPVIYEGSTVLSTSPPDPLQMASTLQSEAHKAIQSGALPVPGSNYDTIYLFHCPSNVSCLAGSGATLCGQGAGVCGQHTDDYYNGIHYQVAIVPLNCPYVCSPSLVGNTWIGEHEVGEALADEGSASFEVGDFCESGSNITSLACCGQTYTIQQMDTPSGPGVCETINATGSACTCGVAQVQCTGDGGTCCQGLSCQPWVAQIGNQPTTVCCYETGQGCGSTNDCCGGLACQGGKCVCQPPGQFCLRDVDCCSTGAKYVCDQQKCVAAPPDAGAPEAGGPDSGMRPPSGEPGASDAGPSHDATVLDSSMLTSEAGAAFDAPSADAGSGAQSSG